MTLDIVMSDKLSKDDIQVSEFGTSDYRVQIKKSLSKPCYEIKQKILDNQTNADRLKVLLRVHKINDNELFNFNKDIHDWKEKAIKYDDLLKANSEVVQNNITLSQLQDKLNKINDICDNIDFEDLIDRISDMTPELKKTGDMPIVCYKFQELEKILKDDA